MFGTTGGIAAAATAGAKLVFEGGKWVWKEVKQNKETKARNWAAAQADMRAIEAHRQQTFQAISRLATEKAIAKTNTDETPAHQLGLDQDQGGFLESFKKMDKNILMGAGLVAVLLLARK